MDVQNTPLMKYPLLPLFALALGLAPLSSPAKTADGKQKLVLVAGKPSHPPRMHEYNAGMLLLAKCLAQGAPDLKVEVVRNGWPQDESVFDGADAVVFYMDGGARHDTVQEGGARLAKIDEWTKRGVGIGALHYGVEVVADQAGDQFRRWIGGHYENMYSCNPMWEPNFTSFPTHPITRGVQPFQIKDEWYFNMRFTDGFTADGATEKDGTKFVPILVAKPGDEVRNGPYVAPKGPYPHIQAATGRPEAMMWCVERPRRRPRLWLHRRPFPRQLGQRQLPQSRPQRPRLDFQGRSPCRRHRVAHHPRGPRRQPRSQAAEEIAADLAGKITIPFLGGA